VDSLCCKTRSWWDCLKRFRVTFLASAHTGEKLWESHSCRSGERSCMKMCSAVLRQLFGKHVPAVTDTHATIEVLLETGFSTQFVPRSYKEENWSNHRHLEGSRRSERTWARKQRIAIVRSRYQKRLRHRGPKKYLAYAVVICEVWKSAIFL
jgi:hypothetical protein